MAEFIELICLLVILTLVFGARRLPALGELIGRLIHRVPAPARRPDDEALPTTAAASRRELDREIAKT